MQEPRKNAKEALLWSRGVARNTVVCYAAIWLFGKYFVRGREIVTHALLKSIHRVEYWTSLSLLSSSCCLIQLVLNLASIGCAGFNTILGPLRPFSLAFLLYAQTAIYSIRLEEPIPLRIRCTATLASAIVALSPEFIAGMQILRRRCFRKYATNNSTMSTTVYLPTMGCIACIDAIHRALYQVDGVYDADIKLGQVGGQATVYHDSDLHLDILLQACERSGFPNGTLVNN